MISSVGHDESTARIYISANAHLVYPGREIDGVEPDIIEVRLVLLVRDTKAFGIVGL
jgi:hypothetical protein